MSNNIIRNYRSEDPALEEIMILGRNNCGAPSGIKLCIRYRQPSVALLSQTSFHDAEDEFEDDDEAERADGYAVPEHPCVGFDLDEDTIDVMIEWLTIAKEKLGQPPAKDGETPY